MTSLLANRISAIATLRAAEIAASDAIDVAMARIASDLPILTDDEFDAMTDDEMDARFLAEERIKDECGANAAADAVSVARHAVVAAGMAEVRANRRVPMALRRILDDVVPGSRAYRMFFNNVIKWGDRPMQGVSI